jgi:hypothetical protein
MTRLSAALLAAAVALCGCEAPAPLRGQAQADAATVAACRQRANQIYDQQNRGAIFSQQSQANMPFSANYTPDVPTRGLSAQFGFDRTVNDCIRNTGADTSRTPTGTTGTAAAATAPAMASPGPSDKTALPPPPARP